MSAEAGMPAAPDGSGEVDKSAETGAGAPTSWDIDDTWARTDSKAAGGALGTEPMVAWIWLTWESTAGRPST
jgi:hypothetical protein